MYLTLIGSLLMLKSIGLICMLHYYSMTDLFPIIIFYLLVWFTWDNVNIEKHKSIMHVLFLLLND